MTISSLGQHWLRFRLNPHKRIFIYQSMYRLLRNGRGLDDTIEKVYEVISDQGRRKKEFYVLPRADVVFLHDALLRLKQGEVLADTLFEWVPEQEAMTLQTGEETGELSKACDAVLRQVQKTSLIKSTIFRALIYPVVLSLVGIGVMIFINQNLMPSIERIMRGQPLTGWAALLSRVSDMFLNYGACGALVIGGAIIGLVVAMPRWRGPNRVWFDRIPPFALYRLLFGSTFIMSLSSMVKAGISEDEGLARMKERANPWLRQRIEGARYGLAMGDNLGIALENAGHEFPDRQAIAFIKILAEQEDYEDSLEQYGNDWLDDSIKFIEKAAKVVNFIGILMVGSIIFLAVAGMLSINQNILQML